ncbi:MAG TPA: hypothetical protein VFH61_00860, partial [Thermoleophilia bacterium]|nr:hypothetical protein [Thermoleophilia bacterium]
MRVLPCFILIAVLALSACGAADEVPVVVKGGRFSRPLAHARLYAPANDRKARELPLLGETDAAGELLLEVDPADKKAPSFYILSPDLSRWQLVLRAEEDSRERVDSGAMRDVAALKCESVWTTQGEQRVLSVSVPGTGTIEATVVGPDGRVLNDTAVEVYPSPRGESKMRLAGRTDAEGRISVRLFPGRYSMHIVARGVGFGATGTIEVRPDEAARADLPPLVPFGTVEGRVGKAAVTEGGHVRTDRSEFWNMTRASVDKEGRFILKDVTPGLHRIVYEVHGAAESVEVTVRPGKAVRGVLLKAREAVLDGAATMRLSWSGMAIISGRVTYQDGRPAAGARIYVVSVYHGGLRMNQEIGVATANLRGEYTMPPVRAGLGRIALVARVEGFPPALGMIPPSSLPGVEQDQQQVKLGADLVIAAEGGELNVHVVTDGKPVVNAVVVLLPEGYSRSFAVNPYVKTLAGADLEKEINALILPARRTGEDGVATFSDLVPGDYAVLAVAGFEEAEARALALIGTRSSPLLVRGAADELANRISGVPVAVGETRTVSITLYRQPMTVKPRVIHPEGFPITGRDFAQVQVLSILPSGYWLRTGNGPKGEPEIQFDGPGYRGIEVRYRPKELGTGRIETEPYFRGRACLAVSALMPKDRVVEVHLARVDAGSIEAHLLDQNGKPLQGWVVIEAYDAPRAMGCTDKQGCLLFSDLLSGSYTLRAYADAVAAADVD